MQVDVLGIDLAKRVFQLHGETAGAMSATGSPPGGGRASLARWCWLAWWWSWPCRC